MGIGGDFFITAAAREIKQKHNKKVFVTSNNFLCNLQNKIGKFLYVPFPKEKVFENNKNISSGIVTNKDIIINRFDEKISYASEELDDRFIFKENSHAVQIICDFFRTEVKSNKPEIFFSKKEELEFKKNLMDLESPYVVIEPNIKSGFLGNNRAWKFDNWQKLIDKNFEKINFIQVGDGSGKSLKNLYKNFNGNKSLRETIYIIKKSNLFIGTDSGLMHAARAVDTKSLILYHRINSLKLIGYNFNENLVLSDIECANCGFKENYCPNDNKCMDFDLDFVDKKLKAIYDLL